MITGVVMLVVGLVLMGVSSSVVVFVGGLVLAGIGLFILVGPHANSRERET